jgi:glutamine amidotransferase
MGNLRSVAKALEIVGCAVSWVSHPASLKRSDVLVLPGVGAYALAVQNLKKKKLFEPIQDWVQKQKPFLGICLGYQLLFERSEEAPHKKIKGMALFPGTVKRLPLKKNIRIPHMGWNQIYFLPGGSFAKERDANNAHALFKGIPEGSYFYFVHSYVPVPKQKELVLTTTRYGVEFASSIYAPNLFASQFHPEKSGNNGLALLKNFIRACS